MFFGRPCAAMVHGQVTMCGNGVEYHPWFGVLDPDEVAEVARDIVLVDEPVAVPGRRERVLYEADYVSRYLGAAREFACDLADEQSGLVYTIGSVGQFKMLMARASTMATVVRAITDCTAIRSLAQRCIGMVSVGLKAVALVKDT